VFHEDFPEEKNIVGRVVSAIFLRVLALLRWLNAGLDAVCPSNPAVTPLHCTKLGMNPITAGGTSRRPANPSLVAFSARSEFFGRLVAALPLSQELSNIGQVGETTAIALPAIEGVLNCGRRVSQKELRPLPRLLLA